jgi:hypothetical protein
MQTIAQYITEGAYPVVWEMDSRGRHIITYGAETTCVRDSLEAGHRFGEYVRHAAECDGRFDRQ